MFSRKFSVCSASLNLLKTGEQGVVTHLRSNDETVLNKLIAMGMLPGIKITLEQCFPLFVIKVGNTRLALEEIIAQSIFVRIIDS